jgi:hypothetical protein
MSFLYRVSKALDAAGVRYALVGGYAVALHGAVRGTIDIDLVVRWSLRDLQAAEAALGDIGLVSRLQGKAQGADGDTGRANPGAQPQGPDCNEAGERPTAGPR